jgi:hypothetical protein
VLELGDDDLAGDAQRLRDVLLSEYGLNPT